MPLDPQARVFLDQMEANGAPALNTLSPQDARKVFDMAIQQLRMNPEPVARVEDMSIPGPAGDLRVRVYTPEGKPPFPVLVFFHGGGFVVGSLDGYDELCRALTNSSGCLLVSVDYRLAPECKCPGPVEDCYAATKWVAENADTLGCDADRLAVGGDSAGGNLAAVVSLLARDKHTPQVKYQVLMYPVTGAGSTPSMNENGSGYFLTTDDMVWFSAQYLRTEADDKNPLFAPILAETLSGLPPALVVTAEYDPLRDDGEYYADRLRKSGVPCCVHAV